MGRFLVTGGCGFIGSHLVDSLIEDGHSVCVVDDLSTGKKENLSPSAELIEGDVADAERLRRLMPYMDGCFHLAAVASVQRSIEAWVETHRTNQTGAIAVFDAARFGQSRTIPVVYASSAAVYGDNPDLPLRESALPRPLTAYGVDKLGCELHARVAWAVHAVATTGLRFFNVYGPRQDPASPYSGVIAIFAARASHGRHLDVFGDGGQSRDFVFVGDVVRHLRAAMDRCRHGSQIFNVCTGVGTSLLELAAAIGKVTATEPEIRHHEGRVGDIRMSLGNPAAAISTLGLAATVPLLEGLKITLSEEQRVAP